MQYNMIDTLYTKQCNLLQYDMVKYVATWYNTGQYNTEQNVMIQYGIVPYNIIQYDVMLYDSMQHNKELRIIFIVIVKYSENTFHTTIWRLDGSVPYCIRIVINYNLIRYSTMWYNIKQC